MGVFTKIGGAVKRVAQRAGSVIKSGVKKVAPIIHNIAEKGTSLLSNMPGMIGTAAAIANKGLGTARDLVSQIPNEKARDAMNNVINRGSNIVDRGQNTATNITNRVSGTAAPLLNMAGNIAKRVS